MGDRMTAGQRLEARFNLFLTNEFHQLTIQVVELRANQKILLWFMGAILTAIIAGILTVVLT